MAQMNPLDAWELAKLNGIPLGADFHALDSATVDSIVAVADLVKYRKSKGAPGSRARMFYAYLNRRAQAGHKAALVAAKRIESQRSLITGRKLAT